MLSRVEKQNKIYNLRTSLINFCCNLGSPFPKQSQNFRSVIQDGSGLLVLIWEEKTSAFQNNTEIQDQTDLEFRDCFGRKIHRLKDKEIRPPMCRNYTDFRLKEKWRVGGYLRERKLSCLQLHRVKVHFSNHRNCSVDYDLGISALLILQINYCIYVSLTEYSEPKAHSPPPPQFSQHALSIQPHW